MILVDAHVHIYDCFDLEKFFDSAYSNFKSAANKFRVGKDYIGILLLSETSKENWFSHLSDYADGETLPKSKKTGAWKFYHTCENHSLYAKYNDSKNLIIIAGRQIQTDEGLELLAIGVDCDFKDGITMSELIRMVDSAGGIPIVPWGFGKWSGRRGRYLRQMLNNPENRRVFIGDNSGRPAFFPDPSIFKSIRYSNVAILPGTDPLPFPAEYNRVGSFGFFTQMKISDNYPARDIRNVLLNSEKELKPYGNLEKPLRFIRNQIAMQVRKRFKNKLGS